FGGAQLHLGRALKKGKKAVLEIEPFGSFDTEIRWSADGEVGIKFNDDQAKVAELVMAIATYA
ncbi:MAG: hypothetical protein IIA35_07130, partial [Proteobacteria bacterium]|nr:hypothetical protein [Pseudomonadota bacterium]